MASHFHSTLKVIQLTAQANKNTSYFKEHGFPAKDLWDKVIGPFLLNNILNRKNIYHVIAIPSHAGALLDWPQFEFLNISCECKCEKVNKTHIHMLGVCSVDRNVRSRFFKKLNTTLGLQVQARSSVNQKFIYIKDFQHLVATYVYITREQYYTSNSFLGIQCKHMNFLPFGLSDYSVRHVSKDFLTNLWNNIIYPYLSDNGYAEQVIEAKRKYALYKEQNKTLSSGSKYNHRRASKRKFVDPSLPSCSTEKKSRPSALLPGMRLEERTQWFYDLIRNDTDLGLILCIDDDRKRVIQFLRDNPDKVVGGLCEFVVKCGSET